MRVGGYMAAFVGGLFFCLLLVSVGVVDRVDGVPGTQQEPMLSLPTYLSFLSVMLTAVTVVLTAVAIGIGIIAAYTFKERKYEARITSAKTSEEVSKTVASAVAADALSDVKVRAIVFEIYAKDKKERDEKIEWGEEKDDNEDR